MLKVGDIEETLAKREEGTFSAKLEYFSVDPEATELRIKTGFDTTETFQLDEVANKALANYLSIPATYFSKVTPDFRATLLEYEFARNSEATTVLESLKGDIVAVHQPGQTMLPLKRVGEVITKVMKPEDTVRRMLVDPKRLHVDVTTADSQVDTASYPNNDFPGQPAQVGDITEGGLRVISYPFQDKKPSVGAYIERLVCTNGMCTEEKFGAISLQGNTLDEVMISMEEAANEVLGTLDARLHDYASTRTMACPGSPIAFATQLAKERGVGIKVLTAVIDIINQLNEPISVWDVNQAFTSVANQMTTYGAMMRLQSLGGELAFYADKAVERCHTCEQKIAS